MYVNWILMKKNDKSDKLANEGAEINNSVRIELKSSP